MWAREAFLGEETLLPELSAIGRSRQGAAVGGSLTPHEHDHAFEVVLVESGSLRWWVEDEEYTLSSDALFLTRPGEVHGAVDEVLEPSDIRWAQFRFDVPGAFGLSVETAKALERQLNKANRIGQATVAQRYHLKFLLRSHQTRTSQAELVRAHAVCLLNDVIESLSRPIESNADPRIAEILDLMRSNLDSDLSVDAIARRVDISASWLHELFHRSTGMTIGAWLAKERVERAKLLLADPAHSITSIALDVGFSSSQYFATVFKKHTGNTPRAFREKHRLK